MGQTRATFCDEETCNRLAPAGYTGGWLRVATLDLDFCSVSCALDYQRTYGDAFVDAEIAAVIRERSMLNPEARAEERAWRTEHARDADFGLPAVAAPPVNESEA